MQFKCSNPPKTIGSFAMYILYYNFFSINTLSIIFTMSIPLFKISVKIDKLVG